MACCEMPGAEAEPAPADARAAIPATIERDEQGLLTITVPSETDGETLATGLGFDVSFDNPYDDAPRSDEPYVPSFTATEISALNTPVAPFALVDQEGAPFTNDSLAGRPYIVDFIFTRCSGPCPAMSAQMAKVYRDIRDAGLAVDLVTVSVDPEYDTPEVMKRYSRWFQAGEGWHFLTGDYDVIHHMANDVLGVGLKKYGGKWDAIQYPGRLMADPIPESILHSQRFVLVDDRGIIRGFYEGSEPTDIGRMMRDLELITGTAVAN
jgi:protein SCO1/2